MGGGGGGMGGNGGIGEASSFWSGGGGGLGRGANGGFDAIAPGAGIVSGLGGGAPGGLTNGELRGARGGGLGTVSTGTRDGGGGGFSGGGGGSAGRYSGSSSTPVSSGVGGAGGFGGGGGGGSLSVGGVGGFGGGGGGGTTGGAAGFGGGRGGARPQSVGGFLTGAGSGGGGLGAGGGIAVLNPGVANAVSLNKVNFISNSAIGGNANRLFSSSPGGGGAGFGGAMFVMGQDFSVFGSPYLFNLGGDGSQTVGSAVGGSTVSPASNGAGAGAGFFLQNYGVLVVTNDTGETYTIANTITDERGSGLSGLGGTNGSWGLSKQGAGTLVLGSANYFTELTEAREGTIRLGHALALQNSAVVLAPNQSGNIDFGNLTHATFAMIRDSSGRVLNLENASGQAVELSFGNERYDGDFTFGGVLTGAGSLVKTHPGKQTFTADHTFIGDTTIQAGRLALGNGGTSGSLAGDIVNNSELSLSRAGDYSLSNVISGTGNLTKSFGGDLTLSSVNTYTGQTTLPATGGGTPNQMILSAANAIASSSRVNLGFFTTLISSEDQIYQNINGQGGVLVNGAGASVTLKNTADSVFDGPISGAGALVKSGSGRLTLTGAAQPTGGTTVSEGTLQIGNGGTTGSLTGVIINNSELSLNRVGNYVLASVISGSGNLTKTGAGNMTLTSANLYTGETTLTTLGGNTPNQIILTQANAIANSSRVNLGFFTTLISAEDQTFRNINNLGGVSMTTPGATVTLENTADTTYEGPISGSGSVVKSGNGQLTLTSTYAHAGTTVVASGALLNNGAISSATFVQEDATLGGQGQFNGLVTVESGGILSPGNSPGTITCTDGLTIEEGAILDFELSNPNIVGSGVNDLIAVNGDLTLDGTINVIAINGFTAGDYTLMTSNPLSSFTDNGLEVGNMPEGYSGLVSYDSTSGSMILSVTLEDPTVNFSTWIGTYSLPGGEDQPNSDFDQDGRSNLVEFATGGNPASSTGDPMIAGFLADDGGTDYVTWTIPVLDGGTFAGNPLSAAINGLEYQIICKSGLTQDAPMLPLLERTPIADELPSLPPGYEYRSFRLTSTSEQKAFLRLGLTQAE